VTPDILAVAGGLVLLFLGGEALVRGAVALAARLGLPKLVIGLTVVGFGTSAPELMVSAGAALGGAPEIALGNVVGSNIANILLVLAIGCLICPLAGWDGTSVREALIAALAGLALFGLVHGAVIGRGDGLALSAALVIYLAATFWIARRGNAGSEFEHEVEAFSAPALERVAWLAPALTLAGLVALILGARLLVSGAVDIARAFGVSEAVIGLSLVAVGTSLPELATAGAAAFRRQTDVLLGNLIGSCIFNALGILGLTALIAPIDVASRFADFDTPVMLAASFLLAALLITRRKLGRVVGALMLAGYGAYIWRLAATGTVV